MSDMLTCSTHGLGPNCLTCERDRLSAKCGKLASELYKVRGEREQLRQQLEVARMDRQRMDWLDGHTFRNNYGTEQEITYLVTVLNKTTAREAIDAVMLEEWKVESHA